MLLRKALVLQRSRRNFGPHILYSLITHQRLRSKVIVDHCTQLNRRRFNCVITSFDLEELKFHSQGVRRARRIQNNLQLWARNGLKQVQIAKFHQTIVLNGDIMVACDHSLRANSGQELRTGITHIK